MSTTDTGTDTGAANATGADSGQPADERELGAAGAQLSTAPREELSVPSLGPLGWARWFWRQLTSMRVALLLLFLLSLGAIPGSLIPQQGINPVKVEDFKKEHDLVAPVYEKLGMFHVYSSVWFSAIYILLFVSLIGCIVPRTLQFVGQLRSLPPAAPRRLTRLPAYTTWRTEAEPEKVLQAAHGMIKRRRYRTQTTGNAVAGEKGYLREAGNLLFHCALIVMLVAFAVGQLWKSEGGKLIVEGDGFSNSLTQYDDFKSGALFDSDNLAPFGFKLDRFHVTYERHGPEKRTPRTFQADVSYWEGADGKEQKRSIKVNEPLEVAGSKVYLLNHGYAPVVTVRDGKGDVAYKGAVASLPIDSVNFTENTVIKVSDYRDKNGKKDQLGFQGQFVPTFVPGSGSMFSQFPALDNPALILTAYHGSLGISGGTPQNVYQLDTSRMKQFKEANGKKFARALLPGDTMKLPNGAGTLKFEGVKQWASFQVSHQPGNRWALAGAVAALIGLAGSLFIQRRRMWVRAAAGPDGVTVVEMAGLGRSESAKLPEELGDLALTLQSDAPPAPEPGATDDGAAPEPDGADDKTSAPPTDASETPAAAEPPDAAETPAATESPDGTGPAEAAEPTEAAAEDGGTNESPSPADPSEGARA